MLKKLFFFIVTLTIILSATIPVNGMQDFTGYTKIAEYDNGKIKITSFSPQWGTTDKLKSVYDELLKNFHGDEINLLEEIYLYPDKHDDASGEYKFTYLTQSNGKISLDSGSYINLYNCNTENTLEKIARTLSHEYGHHFTYYYLIQKENKLFEDTDTLYQRVRGLEDNPNVNNQEHRWSLAEIAAEDYVQLFGSLTGKRSLVFHDVTEYSKKDADIVDTGVYNYNPQENIKIRLTANMPEVRRYWLDVMDYSGSPLNNPPSPSYLYLDSVNSIDTSNYSIEKAAYNYKLRWTPGKDDTSKTLEYTVIAYPDSLDEASFPLKTVYSGNELSTIIGYYEHNNTLYWDSITDSIDKYIYVVVYTKDENGNIVESNMLKIDLSNQAEPISSSIQTSQAGDIRVLYNNDFIQFSDVNPVLVNGRTMVPLRRIFECMGATVTWDEATHTVTAIKGNTTIVLQIGNCTAYKNDIPIQLDVSPDVLNDRTLVPLRFIGESFGNEVEWDGVTKVVLIK